MENEPSAQKSARLDGLQPSALMRLGVHTGASPAPPLVPGYEILESLGRGGMGEVFLARQESLGRDVALKVLRTDLAASGWLPERFEREARTMAALHHPHIVTVHDSIRLGDGRTVIVMEYIRGGTLRERIASAKGGIPIAQALTWFRQIADGLRAAHTAGIIHRDVKPENVLIDSAGAARVSDFGMAFSDAPEATRYTQTGTSLGTLGYMAPEQFRGGTVDARSDIFSLGAILYEMLTGHLPQGSFSPAKELRPEIPAAVDTAIQTCLRPDPARRPRDIAALFQIIDSQAGSASPFITRRRAILAGAVVTLVGAELWLNRRYPRKTDAPAAPTGWKPVAWPADPQSSALSGGWRRDGSAVVSDEQICILPLAQSLPDSWSVRLRFRRLTSQFSVEIFFRTPRGTATFTLDAWQKGLCGVQLVDGKAIDETDAFPLLLQNGRAYDWVVEYRAGRIAIFVDGQLRQERDITGKPLAVASPWLWQPGPGSPDLMIGSWKSATRFESVEFRPL
jgi:serine/threonine protein kinase